MKKKMNCDNCGAPLHGTKCEYCGTEYEFDDWSANCLNIKMISTPGRIETLGAKMAVPMMRQARDEPERILEHCIKPQIAETLAKNILNYAEWETWYSPQALEQLFGAKVRVVIPEEGATDYV